MTQSTNEVFFEEKFEMPAWLTFLVMIFVLFGLFGWVYSKLTQNFRDAEFFFKMFIMITIVAVFYWIDRKSFCKVYKDRIVVEGSFLKTKEILIANINKIYISPIFYGPIGTARINKNTRVNVLLTGWKKMNIRSGVVLEVMGATIPVVIPTKKIKELFDILSDLKK